MNGVLVVDKPSGPTSHDVVARVRRAIGIDRIGHTGTLDPLATGVLPLVVGRATRLAQYLSGDEKEYVAGIRFGAVSSTYDAQGTITVGADPGPRNQGINVTRAALEPALARFRGRYEQTPPAFSAKKLAGARAYKLARSRQPVTLKPAAVTVSLLELLSCDRDRSTLRLVCSSGFYVRSLAHDLGQHLGCGALLETLKRTRSGSFAIEDAVPLATVELEGPDVLRRLIPMDRLLPEIPAIALTAAGVRRASHGNSLSAADFADANEIGRLRAGASSEGGTPRVRLLDQAGSLLAIAAIRDDGLLHPVIVLM